MTEWALITRLVLFVFVLFIAFMALGALWDWLTWKFRERRGSRHATQRWLERHHKKESDDDPY